MKACSKCQEVKPLEDFAKNRRTADGRQNQCRICHRLADKALYNKGEGRKQAIVANRKQAVRENRIRIREYLLTHPCVDCGNDDPRVLEFDHVAGKKHKAIAQMHAYSWNTLQAEIAKCEVRCANCHRLKTVDQFGHYADVP